MPQRDATTDVTDLVDSLLESTERPHWLGPCSDDDERGGITWSMLTRYLTCRERFRIQYVEGLSPVEKFKAALEYGDMWHVCEESGSAWRVALLKYTQKLCSQYPLQQEEIEHWYNFCKVQFPIYLDYWSKNPDVKGRTVLMPETTFKVPYQLPSGRTVWLRGKRDSVDLIKAHTDPDGRAYPTGIWLQENKTKSQIDEQEIRVQLSFDGQTMIYLIALRAEYDMLGLSAKGQILGVRYNVVRRSAHKSVESFTKKLTEDKEKGCIGEWFARWKVGIGTEDMKRFRTECLDPLLENLVEDYGWWAYAQEKGLSVWDMKVRARTCVLHQNRHFRMPYGVYNPLLEGAGTSLDFYLRTGSKVGLVRNQPLFPELRG